MEFFGNLFSEHSRCRLGLSTSFGPRPDFNPIDKKFNSKGIIEMWWSGPILVRKSDSKGNSNESVSVKRRLMPS